MKTSIPLSTFFILSFCFCTFFVSGFAEPASAQTSDVAENQKDLGRNNQKIEGYRGIWFTLGQFSEYGDKYSGGLGTYTAKHIPLALYAPQVDKTFFVYGGTPDVKQRHLLCMIGCFEHKTGEVSKPTVVHDKLGVTDPHDNPSLCLAPDGHLWVFVSGRGRGRPGFKYRSTKPYDIESFEQITEEEFTYPQPKYVPEKGFLHLFTKYTGTRLLFFETSSDGVNWNDDVPLVAMKREGDKNGGHYQISGQSGEKVGFFFNWHPNGNVDLRTNIYYLQTTDFGKTWTDVKGNELPIPVTEIDSPALAKEFFSKKINVYIKDMAFDENGNPVAVYVSGGGHQPGPKFATRTWSVIRWTGEKWETHDITQSDHNYDSGSLWITPEKWVVAGPTDDRPQQWGAGGELILWESHDQGRTWARGNQITDKSPRNHNYVRKVVNGKAPFQYFWADGNPDGFGKSQLYFGDLTGKASVLPYDMKQERVKPAPYQPVVPSVFPVDKNVRWITDPTIEPIAEPKMKWGTSNRIYDAQGNTAPFSKDPTVVRFQDRYLMYFSLPPDQKVKTPYGWIIGIAESDDLVNWKKIAEVPPMQKRFSQSDCDAKGLCAPCARVWDGKVHLFYQTYGNGKDDAICYASSENGVDFKPHPQNPIFRPSGSWTCGRAIDADAFIFQDKLFLYAATRNPDMKIQKLVVATTDAENLKDPDNKLGPDAWTQPFDGSILEPELPWETKCIEASTICQRGDKLIMFYAGGYNNDPQQIGVAQSRDGIHWTRLWNIPFIPNGPEGQWNASESGHPGVFVDDDGRTYLFYQGNPNKGKSWFLSCVEIGWKDDIPFVVPTQPGH